MTTEQKATIMLVDDEPHVLADIITQLERDYRLIRARNPVEALAKLANHHGKVNLILLDIQLPKKMEGFDLARTLFGIGYSQESILGYTKHPEQEFHDEAGKLGIKTFPKKLPYKRLKAEIDRRLSP
jgi:CheY-like chemotaxis protein